MTIRHCSDAEVRFLDEDKGALKLQEWLPLLESIKYHECDGMTRCVSTLLTREGVAHTIHAGQVFAHSINSHIPRHFWIEVAHGMLFDIKARMWLGEHESIPHGLFYPTAETQYLSSATIPASSFQYPVHLFQALTGVPLTDFL